MRYLSPWLALFLGFLLGSVITWGALTLAPAEAARSSPLDIIHTIVSQNYYMTQKALAYEQAQTELLLRVAERVKVKPEQSVPLTNRLQQELFGLDLKLKGAKPVRV